MIDFQQISPEALNRYQQILLLCPGRGCEYAFANLYLWGRQQIAFRDDCAALFSHFYGRSVYPMPIGQGDRARVVRDIMDDARQRGLPCRITGVTARDQVFLEEAFPDTFHFRPDRDSFDYVYDIDSLADLRGRKYQKKRNHFNRFQAEHPDYRVEVLGEDKLPRAEAMVEAWYETRRKTDPQGNYLLERRAMARAFAHYRELNLEGLLLCRGEEILALTMASRMGPDTYDIHFEKAREDVDGAYAAVNCEFARYLRQTHPEVRFLNREDDMGLEGLRKAKLSYLPHHMVEKSYAYLKEELYAP